MCTANLIRFLFARAMEIWDRECGPFQPTFTVFTILGQAAKTISPLVKGPRKK